MPLLSSSAVVLAYFIVNSVFERIKMMMMMTMMMWQVAVLDEFDHKHLDKDVDYFKNVVRSASRCSVAD